MVRRGMGGGTTAHEQVDEAAHQASLGLAPGDEVSDTEGLEAIAVDVCSELSVFIANDMKYTIIAAKQQGPYCHPHCWRPW